MTNISNIDLPSDLEGVAPKLREGGGNFQISHGVGNALSRGIYVYDTINDIMTAANRPWAGADHFTNGAVLPSHVRGGEAIGSTVHNGRQLSDFDYLMSKGK